MSLVVYLAHPVAPSNEQRAAFREDWDDDVSEFQFTDRIVELNLSSARIWLRWLVTHTDWAVSAPWMPYVQALNDSVSSMRARGLRDDCTMAARCDAIILCGGRISSGMAMERDAVQRAGKAVVSLVDLGALPPSNDDLAAMRLGSDPGAMLQRRLREALGG